MRLLSPLCCRHVERTAPRAQLAPPGHRPSPRRARRHTGADCQAVVVTVSQLLAVPHPETNAARLVGLLEYARLKGRPFEGGASGRGFGLRGQLNPSLGNPKHQRLVGTKTVAKDSDADHRSRSAVAPRLAREAGPAGGAPARALAVAVEGQAAAVERSLSQAAPGTLKACNRG